jgi:hypothetical protein
MIDKLSPTLNIAQKVKNTKLPKTKPLMPLFECISNSIHAIGEAQYNEQIIDNGEIRINVIRNGDHQMLLALPIIDEYPVKSFEIIDNGIGLNDENLTCFVESDTDHKVSMGGKGVGRFTALVAFGYLKIESTFLSNDGRKYREFEFKATKVGFHNYKEEKGDSRVLETKVSLIDYKELYKKVAPRELYQIAMEIVEHFLLYFIDGAAPKITVNNQNNEFFNLQNVFQTEFTADIQRDQFEVAGYKFRIFLAKSYKAKSHRLFFCAHNRAVKDEGLVARIIDLGKYSVKSPEGNFYYQAYIVSEILDEYVALWRRRRR